jgi:hypothetical protein
MNEGAPVQTSSTVATVVAVTAHSALTTGAHDITAAGAAITTAANAAAQRTAMGVAYGTTGSTVCVGNDSRLSDARTPVAHNQAWSTITETPTTISGYGLTDAASTGANTLTGAQLIRAAATQDAIEILGRAGGTSSFKATITPLELSASRTWSLPDRSDTFAGLKSNTFTEAQIIGTDPGGSEKLRVGGSVNISGLGYRVAGTKIIGGQASAIADVSTADATDLTSAIALANANKAKVNAILSMLRTHGLIAT